nr:FeoA family protein [Cyanobium sp. LEGE 06113]
MTWPDIGKGVAALRRWRSWPGLWRSAAAYVKPGDPANPSRLDASSFLLAEACLEEPLWVVEVSAQAELRDRLISMGLHRGCPLRVVMRAARDSHLVAVANARLALDGAMSRAIRVRRSAIQIAPDAPSSSIPSLASSMDMSPQGPTQQSGSAHPVDQVQLQTLPAGSRGRVQGYRQGSRSYRQKLLAMGLTPGTEFEVTRHAPMGDPVELKVRGFSLMLRKHEADMLIVTVLRHA